LAQYLDTSATVQVVRAEAGFGERPASSQSALAGLLRTAVEVRAMGRKIVLFAPPPSVEFDIGACLERKLSGRLALGATENCLITRAEYLQQKKAVIELVDAAEKAGLPVIRFDPVLCDTHTCQTMLDGVMIYRDGGHFSHGGSTYLGATMAWGDLIRARAQ
jgi:hypothetical protein